MIEFLCDLCGAIKSIDEEIEKTLLPGTELQFNCSVCKKCNDLMESVDSDKIYEAMGSHDRWRGYMQTLKRLEFHHKYIDPNCIGNAIAGCLDAMEESGELKEDTTFDDVVKWAGSHIEIVERKPDGD